MIVVDSSVWIDRLRGIRSSEVGELDRLIETPDLILGDLVLFEILRGARDHRHATRLEAQMRAFTLYRMVDPELAVAAARHSRALRGVGVTVRKSMDLLIATFCIERGHALLHQDRDFDMIARHLDLKLA